MPVGARFLTRALEAWIGIIEFFGARGMRWEWRKRAWRLALETRLANWENVERSIRTTTRMCPSCRALVEGGVNTCPSCGSSLRGVPKGGISRAFAHLGPVAPSLSVLLVTSYVLMAIAGIMLGGASTSPSLMRFLSPSNATLFLLGSCFKPAIVAGQYWRLITANYLHGGLLHLFMNSYALMTLGPLIEESFGARRLFVLYTLSGVAGYMASALVHPFVPSVGASAALYGLLGFAVVYGRFRSAGAGRAIADQLSRWLIYGLLLSFLPGIDIAAHIGGLIPGALFGLFYEPGEPREPVSRTCLWLAFAACILVTAGSFVAMVLSYADNLKVLSG